MGEICSAVENTLWRDFHAGLLIVKWVIDIRSSLSPLAGTGVTAGRAKFKAWSRLNSLAPCLKGGHFPDNAVCVGRTVEERAVLREFLGKHICFLVH